ncbi:hypothetical protein HNQ56_003709 [Anaerotaenia torta]
MDEKGCRKDLPEHLPHILEQNGVKIRRKEGEVRL